MHGYLGFFGPHGGKQIAQLFVNLFRQGDRLGNFRAQQFLIAASQAMHGDLDGWFTDIQLLSDLRIRFVHTLAGQDSFQALEQLFLTSAGKLLAQPGQRLLENSQCPVPLKESLRGRVVHGLPVVTTLPKLEIQGEHRTAAAAFLGMGAFSFLR